MSLTAVYDNFKVIQELGHGFSADGQLLALKVFKNQQSFLFENEIKMMKLLNDCPGVIHIKSCLDEPQGIMMEYAEQGTMCNFLQNKGLGFDVARSYFRQLLISKNQIGKCYQGYKVLEGIFKKGIVHRDLKLENILLDEEFNLKLCDFGFAAKYLDHQGRRIKLNDHLGTPGTAAPELFQPGPYSAVEADLFMIGVVLFQLCAGFSPFKCANYKVDQLYLLIKNNQIKRFWEVHEQKLNFPDDLKDLLSKMLAYNPNQRLSIQEIKMHPWMQQKDADKKTIMDEMTQRKIIYQNSQKEENENKSLKQT